MKEDLINIPLKFNLWDKTKKEMVYIEDHYGWFTENKILNFKDLDNKYVYLPYVGYSDRNNLELYLYDIVEVFLNPLVVQQASEETDQEIPKQYNAIIVPLHGSYTIYSKYFNNGGPIGKLGMAERSVKVGNMFENKDLYK